ncbi:MAG: putative quinol monooxygenase [Ilumatobacteraceae bacterium]
MIVVGGTFDVDPAQRDAFLAERVAMMRRSRAEHGCLEYTFAADPAEPGRVVLFERWTDQAALDAHLAALRSDPVGPVPRVAAASTSIVLYDVSGERKLV